MRACREHAETLFEKLEMRQVDFDFDDDYKPNMSSLNKTSSRKSASISYGNFVQGCFHMHTSACACIFVRIYAHMSARVGFFALLRGDCLENSKE